MRIGIVFYSRTGNTKKAATDIAEKCKAKNHTVDLIEVQAEKTPGFFSAGSASMKERELPITNKPQDLGTYDLVLFGAPNWANRPAPLLKTFLTKAIMSRQVAAAGFIAGSADPQKQQPSIAVLEQWLKDKGCTVKQPGLLLDMHRGSIRRASQSLDEFLAAVLK